MFINHLYAFHQALTPPNERVLGPEEFLREWNIDEIAKMVFDESGTDMIVKVPEQNVVYTGDLLFSGWYPVCFDEKATISGWRDTLKKFAALDKDTLFVPGHGQICGQEGIASIREVFDDIAGQAEKMYKGGVPAEEAQHRYVVPDKFKNFPVFAWGFTIGPAITKLYAEWGAK